MAGSRQAAELQQASQLAEYISFTTSGALVDLTDKKVMVVLRDGRKLIGVLRSYDQFANLVLQDTIERIFVGNRFGDIPHGLFLVRGENVVLMGEIDLDAEDEIPPSIASPVAPAALPQLLQAQAAHKEANAVMERRKAEILIQTAGFCPEGAEGDQYLH
ncbi:hypothetical protein CF327_g4514 [Tilletia walkeri]|uniref:U6 snRNA-associated Sm-like protein LSm1 n=2 Tax=Tilletia TaxID=13289 RepID=A0A8X7T6C3_9BASI|nr:hypothetical protein CF327_g4514 [Tilletia walkeri]KAE8233771.1 hypothetical protein CF326_g1187 [Tilletia indica]KAE8258586.1 hypothetical protein A4X13_0g1592 [Tilletia indica]KAE8269133.1 hypothetical protein A4X09_0g3221 [Tilletia walkeri]